MTDNEKAAIAAGLWEPTQMKRVPIRGTQDWQGKQEVLEWGDRPVPAPDMHDPANLWRALITIEWFNVGRDSGVDEDEKFFCYIHPKDIEGWGLTLNDAVFAALVALYEAEHPS